MSMIKWFKKLLSNESQPWGDPEIGLKRQRTSDISFGGGGIGMNRILNPAGSIFLKQYRYWCKCGTELTDGPTGGCAINAVCEKCRINYGCLPGYD